MAVLPEGESVNWDYVGVFLAGVGTATVIITIALFMAASSFTEAFKRVVEASLEFDQPDRTIMSSKSGDESV
jgi:hypothetical protein